MSTEDTRKVKREQAGDRSVEYETSKEARDEEERAEIRATRRARGYFAKIKITK